MNVSVVYVHPAVEPLAYRPLAKRFVDTYMQYPPGAHDHRISVVVNGGAPSHQKNYERLMSPLPCSFLYHTNIGKDIGAFQKAAAEIKCDLMICLGAPVYFRRAGWLDRIVQAYEDHGPALYGAWGFHNPATHIRTTAFWMPPELLNSYPYVVTNDARYEFEHGTRSITSHVAALGLECYMVTWDGCYPRKDWHHVELERCMFRDQHTDRNALA